MRKILEGDSEESMDQMVFGGIRDHVLKEKNGGIDVSFEINKFDRDGKFLSSISLGLCLICKKGQINHHFVSSNI